MALGKEIKRLRDQANISADNLAKWMGVSVQALRKWEARDSSPKKIEDRIAIEKYFDCPTVDLDKLDKFKFYIPDVDSNLPVVSEGKEGYEHKNFKELYYQKLEAENTLLKKMVETLETMVKKVDASLDMILENQLTMTSMTMGFEEAVLEKLSKDRKEFDLLLQSAHNKGAVLLKDALKKGNRLQMDTVDKVHGS